jgi:hypothetical protein
MRPGRLKTLIPGLDVSNIPIINLDRSTLKNKVLHLVRECVERTDGLKQFQQPIDLLKTDENYSTEPLACLRRIEKVA